MAELLKRQYDIVVLKTELLNAAREGADVRFTLQCKLDGELQDLRSWPGHTGEMGLREFIDKPKGSGFAEPKIQLPDGLLDDLASWINENPAGSRPLWVHLVEPYGALRLVPWERLLGEVLQCPILMLPDFLFPPPREAPSTLDVVLCASAPLGSEEYSVYQSVRLAAGRILEGSPRRTRLHVFVDAQFADALRDEWRTAGWLDQDIFVYDNQAAAPYVLEDPSSRLLDKAGALRSPWLLWMREALRKRAVDVVHFCCHGYLSRGRGALLFAQSPLDRSSRYLAGPVGMVELQTFLTQVGAWASGFTSLPDNFSEPGLRALADEVAQSRPGPVLMHNLRADPCAGMLAAGYRFLFSITPQPAPVSTSLFLYCQPYLSVESTPGPGEWSQSRSAGPVFAQLARTPLQHVHAMRSLEPSPLDPKFDREENVEPWIAATERYAELVQLHYQELARDELLPGDLESRHYTLAMETLAGLRAAVADEFRLTSGSTS